MTNNEILSSLCYYDIRHTDFLCNECYQHECDCEDRGNKTMEEQKDCYCDNCFHGKAEMANHILSITEKK